MGKIALKPATALRVLCSGWHPNTLSRRTFCCSGRRLRLIASRRRLRRSLCRPSQWCTWRRYLNVGSVKPLNASRRSHRSKAAKAKRMANLEDAGRWLNYRKRLPLVTVWKSELRDDGPDSQNVIHHYRIVRQHRLLHPSPYLYATDCKNDSCFGIKLPS
jgi:hypothetical protein